MEEKCEFTSCGCWDMILFKIFNFDFRFEQEVKVKLGHFFINIFWQLTICTMEEKWWIYLLWFMRYDF